MDKRGFDDSDYSVVARKSPAPNAIATNWVGSPTETHPANRQIVLSVQAWNPCLRSEKLRGAAV
jgi:hypothetical protein